jgi:DNA replication protein DnaC
VETGKRKKTDPTRISDLIISEIIGKKPRMPQTYAMRRIRNNPEDIEFCDSIDKRISEWDKKADKVRKQKTIEKKKNIKLSDDFVVKKIPPIILKPEQIYADFIRVYKILSKKDFQEKNPYSETDEPYLYVKTLIYYFMKDDRFFKSPLLRKDLSEPSFEKGTLSIGGYGCGKTTTFNALLFCFKNFLKHVEKTTPENQKELKNKYSVNKCISSEIVHRYDTAISKHDLNEILKPLIGSTDLYVDDIMREKDAQNFGKNNIFLNVLTIRADRDYKSHLSMNPVEIKVNDEITFKNTEESLQEFRIRYDGRIHDRLFGNYNIIELTGKSFRR